MMKLMCYWSLMCCYFVNGILVKNYVKSLPNYKMGNLILWIQLPNRPNSRVCPKCSFRSVNTIEYCLSFTVSDKLLSLQYLYLHNLQDNKGLGLIMLLLFESMIKIQPHVVGAQLYRLSTVDAHTDVLKPIHGKIIWHYSRYCAVAFCFQLVGVLITPMRTVIHLSWTWH